MLRKLSTHSLYSDFASICTLLKTRKYSICVGIVGKWGDTIGHQQLRTRPDVAAKQCFAKVSNTCNSESGKHPNKICPYEYMTNVINQIVMIKIILFTSFRDTPKVDLVSIPDICHFFYTGKIFGEQGNYSLRRPPKLVIQQAVIGKDGLLYIQTCTSKQSYTARVRVDCAV